MIHLVTIQENRTIFYISKQAYVKHTYTGGIKRNRKSQVLSTSLSIFNFGYVGISVCGYAGEV